MNLTTEPLHDLQRWPRNAKDHDLGAITQSINRVGYVDPIVVDDSTGRIVSGHGRLDALVQAHGRGEPPPRRVELRDDGEWLVPVLHVEFRDETEARAYLIGANQTVISGGWHDALLAEVLTLQALTPSKLDGTGFDEDDLDDLLQRLNGIKPPEPASTERRVTCPSCGTSFAV